MKTLIFSLLIYLVLISPLKAQTFEEGVEIEGKVLMLFPCPKSAIVLFFDENHRSKRIKVLLEECNKPLYPGDIIRFRLIKTFNGQFLAKNVIIKKRGDFTGVRKRLRKSIRKEWSRGVRKEWHRQERRGRERERERGRERGGGHGGGRGR
ncbi:hypothetical protein [Thermodesulfatator indicus]